MKTIYVPATAFLWLAIICQAQNAPRDVKLAAASGKSQTANPSQVLKKPSTKPPQKPPESTSQPPADKDLQKTSPSLVRCAIYKSGEASEPSDLSKLQALCPDSPTVPQAKNIPNAGLGTDLFLWITLDNGKIIGDAGEIGIDALRLFINEVEIDDSKCAWVVANNTNAIVRAKLERPLSSKTAWNQILAQGLRWHVVRVTVGADKKKPLPSLAQLGLYIMQFKWYFWLFLGIFVILTVVLLTNDRFKQMLRDDGPVINNAVAAYSLSRVQMAYWFALAIVAYAFIWGITGDRDTVNNDILALIGISSGTFLGAVAIDSSKRSQAQTQIVGTTANLVQAQNVAAAAPAAIAPAAATAVTIQTEAVNRLQRQALADHRENFLTDILSDENGISFHRFQIVAWSLVLGVIFIQYVWTTLSMPTFGNTLLGLMGISGGTYLGFKFPEQKTN